MDRRALATVALAVCLLTACTGDPEPKIADPSPTPTVSPSAASASPPVTDAVDPETPYRVFIEAYVGAISTSLSTGDPGPWLAMSDPACENCRNLARGVRAGFKDGGQITGGLWSLDEAEYARDGDLGQVWGAKISRAQEVWLDSQGDQVRLVEPGELHFELAITSTDEMLVRELRAIDG